jgi:hypothetical protein
VQLPTGGVRSGYTAHTLTSQGMAAVWLSGNISRFLPTAAACRSRPPRGSVPTSTIKVGLLSSCAPGLLSRSYASYNLLTLPISVDDCPCSGGATQHIGFTARWGCPYLPALVSVSHGRKAQFVCRTGEVNLASGQTNLLVCFFSWHPQKSVGQSVGKFSE